MHDGPLKGLDVLLVSADIMKGKVLSAGFVKTFIFQTFFNFSSLLSFLLLSFLFIIILLLSFLTLSPANDID